MGLDVFLVIMAVTCSLQTCLPYRYHFVKVKKCWIEAQSHCREKYTDLATITSAQDSSLMNVTVVSSSEMAWIGLYNDADSWRWSLSDSQFYSTGEREYRNWDDGEPNNYKGTQEICTTVKQSGRWNDLTCEIPGSFICFDGLSNSYTLYEEEMTWNEAQTYCRKYHKDLASVRNQRENDDVTNLIQGQFAWIGLFRDSWKWSDGSNVSFQLWKSGSPDNGKENCGVTLLKERSHWDDKNCTNLYPFFCYSDQTKIKKKLMVKVLVQSSHDVNSPGVKAAILGKAMTTALQVTAQRKQV